MDRENRNDHPFDSRHLRSGEFPGLPVKEQIASIIHEISEPVTAVALNATAAKQALAIDPPDLAMARTAVQCLIRDGGDIVEMVTQLNVLFRGVNPDRTSPDLKKIIDLAYILLAATFPVSNLEVAEVIDNAWAGPTAQV
jgi:nitrogen fixation/metabolism regulation signal transduction histidine kinase